MSFHRLALTAIGLAAFRFAVCATPALAQTASQITPQSVRPAAPVASGAIAIPELAGPSAPAGAARLKVRLAGVSIEEAAGRAGAAAADTSADSAAKTGAGAASPEVAAALAAFAAAVKGKTVTVADIFSAARALEAAYGKAGYVLTRVVVPAQKLRDGGELKVAVIDGFVERIETKDVPQAVKARIEAVLAPLVGRRALTLSQIERALVLAGDTPGTVLKSTLAAGTTPGSSVLVIEARHKIVTGSLSVDNTLGSSLGRINPTLALQLNSAFGLGEQIYTQISGYPGLTGENGFFQDEPRNRQLAIGGVIPLGVDGWSANLEAIRTDSAPDPSAGQSFYSSYDRVSARLKYNIIRSRAFNLSSEAAFDAEEERLSAVTPAAAPVSLDRLRVLRDATDISGVTPWDAFVSARVTATLGLDAFGARSASDAAASSMPLSRQGSDADFGKLEFSTHYGQSLAEHLGIDLFAHGQTSFGKPLARAEQIGLVGDNGLSAFDAGTFQGDSGLVGRAEISSPWTINLGVGGSAGSGTGSSTGSGLATISPYLFGDVGAVWLMQPTAVEQRETTAGSFGLGMRLGAAPNPPGSPDASPFTGLVDQAMLTVEWGHQYRNDGTDAADRFTIFSAIQF